MNESAGISWNFEKVYEDVFPQLLRFISRLTGDAAVAEEFCQDAFIKLYERAGSFPNDAEARYWVFRVAKNLAFNYGTRKGREKKAYGKAARQPPRPAETGEVEYLKKEASERVREALNRLPAKLREVLILKEYGDLNYRDIAAILKISEGNVKVRVYRARERLAGFLSDSEEIYVP